MAINQNVSDLFFNTDFSDCITSDEKGNFTGYHSVKLRTEAEVFLCCLGRLGVGGLPSIEELLCDFHNRI